MSTGTKLFSTLGKTNVRSCMKLSTSNASAYKKHFNTSMGATNPLIDGPDFSYMDGRRTPLNVNQKRRAICQKEAVEKAFKLVEHIDFAVKRSEDKSKAQVAQREQIISSKLKEKGTTFEE